MRGKFYYRFPYPIGGFDTYYRYSTIKQRKRDARFEALPDTYKGPLTDQQRSILHAPISTLVADVQSGKTSSIDILRT